MAFDFKKAYKEYYMPKNKPEIVTLPPANYNDTFCCRRHAMNGLIIRELSPEDVVLYREDTNWIYFVESVTSVGPMDPKRILEISEMTTNVSAGKIFVTAFLDFATYKRFADTLAWETEVWIADMPDHMIHLNGDRFMGPR